MGVERLTDRLCWFDGEPAHWCPACGELHVFRVYRVFPGDQRWTYNENPDSPTFSPAIKFQEPYERPGRPRQTCHYEIKDGIIEYGSDCTHILAGEKVPLLKIPALWPAYAR